MAYPNLVPGMDPQMIVLSYSIILHSIIGLSIAFLEKIFFDAKRCGISTYDAAGGTNSP